MEKRTTKRKKTDKEIIGKRINLELRLFAILKEKSQLRLEILEEKLAEIDRAEERFLDGTPLGTQAKKGMAEEPSP